MTRQEKRPDILVIGAGIVGLAAALKLKMEGVEVAVVDPDPPASGCSSGNAGYLSEANIFPPAALGGLRKLPQMLFDRNGPLVIRPSHLPRFIPWGLQSARAMLPARMAEIVDSLSTLIKPAIASYDPLLHRAGAGDLLEQKGALVVFRTQAALDARARRIPVWERYGVAVAQINAAEVADLEPGLTPRIIGGLFFERSARCRNPRELGERFARELSRSGTRMISAKVRRLEPLSDGTWRAHTASGPIEADGVLVCAGVWSDELLRPLGYRFHLESERGYHLMLPAPGVELARPVSMGEAHFVATPMDGGLRLAGTAEFAGTKAAMNPARADMLFQLAESFLPGLSKRDAVRWMGHRPSLPDMLPAIGRGERHRGLYYSIGHGHNGLTLAAISADMIAAIVLDRPSPVDPTPFSIERFR
jgi:D-amino-acid dehydrogenase